MTEKLTLNSAARVAKNSLVSLIGGVLNKILGVLLVIYAARQLGTDGFGTYSLVLSLLGIFYIITDFGLGTLTTRDLARDTGEEPKYLGNLLLMRLGLSAVAALGMVGTTLVLHYPAEVVVLASVAALSLFFTSNVDTCTAIFNAHERMEIPALVSVMATMLRVGISLGALAAGGGILVLMWVYTIASAAQFVLLSWVLQQYAKIQWKLDLGFWKRLLEQAYPLALANLFWVLYFRIDTVMLASFAGEKAVGLYNAAYRLLEFTLIVPAYYGGAIFPVISASQSVNPQRFLLIYRRSIKYMLVASLPMALGVAALAPKMIEVLYGQAYAASVPVLFILMWCLVIISVNSINIPYLIAMNRQKTVTWITLTSMLVKVGINLWAIPRYGLLGAAWVTIFSEIANIILFWTVLYKPLDLKLKMVRHAFKPVLAGALMYGILKLVPGWDLGFLVLLGVLVYPGILFLVRAFDEVDTEIFGRLLRPTSSGSRKIT